MSNLFDLSSLAMIPTAYKDGKLYSVRPTDGSGDFTFSRGSNLAATRVASSGYIEKGRENLLLQSNTFDTTWTLTSASVTGGHSGYDGTNTAWELLSTAASCRVSQTISTSGVQTMSVYAKAGSVNWMALYVVATAPPYVYFDLANGVLGGVQNNVIDASMEDIGGGWYRCTIAFDKTATEVRIFTATANGTLTTTSGDSIYIQDAQLESGLVSTDVITTTTTSVSAGILEDMPRLDYSGSCPSLLLEPQRTNLAGYSEYIGSSWNPYGNISVTANSALSPEGVQNATQISAAATTTASIGIQDGFSVTANNDYTISFFAKKGAFRYIQLFHGGGQVGSNARTNFDIQEGVVAYEESGVVTANVEDYGNGWYRCTATMEALLTTLQAYIVVAPSADAIRSPSISVTAGDNYYIYGIQIEAGSYPTSYIPTYGSSVTRSADSGVLTSLPDSLADNYTIFLELERMVPSTINAIDMFSFYGSGSSRIRIQSHNPNYFRVRLYAADGSTSGSLYDTSGDFAQGNNYKAAIVYSNGTFKCFANGSLFGTADVVIDISSAYLRTECISKQLLIFPTALTDSECIALTTL